MVDSVSIYIRITVMWTRFRNDGNVPTQYAARTANSKVCLGVLPTATDFASTKSLTKDV